MTPASPQPLAKKGEENDSDELLELMETLFPFLLCQTVLLVGVIGGGRRGEVV